MKALLAKVLGRTGLDNKNSVTAKRRKTNSTGKQGRQKGAIRRKNTGGVCGRPSIPGDASVDDMISILPKDVSPTAKSMFKTSVCQLGLKMYLIVTVVRVETTACKK